MTQYEYLSAGTDVVFPYTSIQAISSDNQAIGGGDPNEQLVSLLNRVFTRITSLESQVANLTTQVNTLRNQLASLQVPEITEHFTLYLYTYTADTDTYPSDAAGEDNEALFTSEGEVYDKDTLKSTGWFTIAEDAANAGRDNGYETPGIWGIKLEVSKRDGKYFIYPSIEDFKYDPQLTNGDALVTTFLQKIEDVKTELVDKIDLVEDKADAVQSTIDGAITTINSSVTNTINSTFNDKFNTKLNSIGITAEKWNSFDTLRATLLDEFSPSNIQTNLGSVLTGLGYTNEKISQLNDVYNKLSGVNNGLDVYINTKITQGMTAEAILNKLADNTEGLTFTDGGITKNRTAKARLNELLFGADSNNDVITADTYMEKTGLTKFKVAVAGVEGASKSIEEVLQSKVGLEDNGVLSRVVAAYASTGVAGSGFNETTFSLWADSTTGKNILRKSVGCISYQDNGVTLYKAVDDMIPSKGQIGYIAQQAAGGICLSGKSYDAPDQCSASLQFTPKTI